MDRAPHPTRPRLLLASRSPRRRAMLTQAGIEFGLARTTLDDGGLMPGNVPPEHWVTALAYLKAAYAARLAPTETVVIGADTLCATDSGLLGQPRDADHARGMIRAMQNARHRVITGVALVTADGRRTTLTDAAAVRVGRITDEQIESYLATDAWRGKAGAYNLADRQAAGWPITVTGDPDTVMGLPMRRLPALINAFTAAETPA
ncbi:MAG: Maf family protein [Planctomycetota bacterium]